MVLENQKKNADIPLFVADSGDALWKSDRIPDPTLPQQKVKASLILDAMALEGMDAMTPGEGDFALVVSEGEFGGKPVAFYDLFRVQAGKIAEHWDVIEPIPPRSEWKNGNGKF